MFSRQKGGSGLTVIGPIVHDPPPVIKRTRSSPAAAARNRGPSDGCPAPGAGDPPGRGRRRGTRSWVRILPVGRGGGEGLADFLHGAASGGADVDDEDAVFALAGGGEGGEFGVGGVDADGGDGGPVALRDETARQGVGYRARGSAYADSDGKFS